MLHSAPEPWERFADAVLRRAGLLCRVARGEPPRDLPGLYVDDADADRLLAELPGLDDGGESDHIAAIRRLTDPVLDRSRVELIASLSGASRFAAIARAAQLSSGEAEVLALLAAVEVDDRRQRLLAYVQDSIHLPRVALATVSRFFPPPQVGVRAVSPGSRMALACLVETDGAGPWATRMANVAPRVAWALAGDDSPDPGLPFGAFMIEGSDRRADDTTRQPPVVLAVGPDRASRIAAARRACAATGLLASPVPDSTPAWDALIREATVSGAAVILEIVGDLSPEARWRIDGADHLAWALASPSEIPLDQLPARPWIELRADDGRADEEDWARLVGDGALPPHPLGREQLRLVALAASALEGDVAAAVRRLASGHLDGMATRVRPARGWGDLVVPPDQRAQLDELVTRYRHRVTVHREWRFAPYPSPGLIALFSGASGTGKTLGAEIVAGDLGLDLYKIDLSSVVSKYIGETERNLERIFTGAAAGNLVLFFDEADALFGKRSEVGDAHDRYANIEVAYLLQRLESYEGIVIMATNLQRNMDQAFLRRIHVAVEFPMPDEAGRRDIWILSFPRGAPTQDIDLDFLARQFRISGGSIRNAAITAAFLAAERGTPITMEAVVLGLKREFQKLGRLSTEVEFDRYFDLVREETDAAPVG
jgi:hypothetical protein